MKKCTHCDKLIKHPKRGLCAKHYRQLYLYGKILKRTSFDKNEITVGDVCEMNLYNSKQEVVGITSFDKEHLSFVEKYKWHLSENGYVTCTKPFMRLHNKIANTRKGFVTDHINRNKLDNRKENLREVLQKHNCYNKECKGYVYTKAYLTEEEAKIGSRLARKKYFGEYAPQIPS